MQVQTNHQGNSLDPIGKPKHVYWQLIQVKTSQHIGKTDTYILKYFVR